MISLAALGLAACAVPQSAPSDDTAPPPEADAGSDADLTAGSGALDLFELLDAEAGPAENVFYSPASIEQAFGLLALGAAGETREQIETTLPPPRDARFLAFKDKDTEVRLANALWLSDQWRFRDAFVSDARRRYDATAERVDMRQPVATAKRINDWADKATEGLIPVVVTPDAVDPSTAAFISNALYFDARWRTYFDGAEQVPFLFGDGRQEDFVLMREDLQIAQVDQGDWTSVRLPYRNARYAMDVVMPKRRVIAQQAPHFTELEEIGAKLARAKPRWVDMRLPRFEIDYDTDLIAPLQAIGLRLPFDKDRADLSRMIAPGQQRVYVDKVKHLSKLQVFDEGTRAAAVTVMRIVPVSAPPPRPDKIDFIVDRPFIVVIRDLETGAVLFLGRIAEPEPLSPKRLEQ